MDSIDFVNMNLIDMDCIHVVPNSRIPDESYIERLFPKCPPKQDNRNNDDSSPTKTPANKHRRRRQLRARKPKATIGDNQANSMADNNGVMATNGTGLNGALNAMTQEATRMLPQRSSRLQFNSLSDNESGAEEQQHRNGGQVLMVEEQIINGADDELSKSNEVDTTATIATRCKIIPSASIRHSMFPRLDEGLSSDALSSDEDDILDRAEDNPVEADDEDDDERTAISGSIKRSHRSANNKHDNTTRVPAKSTTRSSLNRLAREASVKSLIRPSSDTDIETDRMLGSQRQLRAKPSRSNGDNNESASIENNDQSTSQQVSNRATNNGKSSGSNFREVLIEGVLFNVKYLGSTHTNCEGRGEKKDRIHQAEMAIQEVKLRTGESSGAVEVQLFISTEKIMVLDNRHRKLLMDHSLRTISYIADIGNANVLIVKTKSTSDQQQNPLNNNISRSSSSTCHVFESSESRNITKAISQAFQVAYTELLKASGSNGSSGSNDPLVASGYSKELDYQQVLNSQEMSTEELEMFAKRENQREVIVPKQVGEILGLSIVESGWGSVLPTVVIANIKQDGPADKCKKLSIGYQILSVNGISLVGLPLLECQEILRRCKQLSVARLSAVPGPITVEVKIKRPDTKYQLGFSVQNGVICSLLRGGIAERGGVRVGHRIMSINGTTVVGSPHDKIVNMLANSVGEIRMITCLTSLYKLILGEEKPVFY